MLLLAILAAAGKQLTEYKTMALPPIKDPSLTTLMADSTADQTKRAKAFEQEYPGITARVGESGEMSFSNVPGRDIYGPYMDQMATTEVGKEALTELLKPDSGAGLDEKAAATEALGPQGTMAIVTGDGQIASTVVQPTNPFMQPVNSDALFAQQYKQMSTLSNPEDITNARANLIQSTEDWVVTKHETYKLRAQNAQGVAALQAEVAKNEAADRAAYANFNGGVDLGDSDETLLVKQQLNQAQGKAEAEAANALAADPEVKGAKARMQAIDALFTSKISSSLEAAEKEGKIDEQVLGTLIRPDQIAATQTALGLDPSQPLDPKVEKQLRLELVSGKQGPLTRAMETGLNEDMNQVLGASLQQGTAGMYASNVLASKLGGDKNLEKALKDEAKALVSQASVSLDKDGKPKSIQPTKDEVASLQSMALMQARNNVKIKRDAAFEAGVDQWQLPQDPELQAEVKNVIAVMMTERQTAASKSKDYNPANDPTQTFEGLVARLNLVNGNQVNTVKAQKVADWYSSQAAAIPSNLYFGPPATGLAPMDRVSAIAVRGVSVDRGMVGAANSLYQTVYARPVNVLVNTMVTGALQISSAVGNTLLGTGQAIDATEPVEATGGAINYNNPAVSDPNYQIITDYYRGRAGVSAEWLAERDRNLAAARGE